MFRGEHMWIVAKTRPNQEYRAELNLCNQGFECYIPEINSKKFVNNVWKDIKEKMFTGYLFIKLNKKIKNLHKINNTYGVSKLLMNIETGMPCVMKNDAMVKISKEIQKINNKEIKQGDQVVITKGQQSKLSGIFIEKCSKKRAKLLINILNRSKEVFVKLESIQKVY